MRDLLIVLGQFALAALVMVTAVTWFAVMTRVNPYDLMPIRCGHKLKDTCPPSGISWRR